MSSVKELIPAPLLLERWMLGQTYLLSLCSSIDSLLLPTIYLFMAIHIISYISTTFCWLDLCCANVTTILLLPSHLWVCYFGWSRPYMTNRAFFLTLLLLEYEMTRPFIGHPKVRVYRFNLEHPFFKKMGHLFFLLHYSGILLQLSWFLVDDGCCSQSFLCSVHICLILEQVAWDRPSQGGRCPASTSHPQLFCYCYILSKGKANWLSQWIFVAHISGSFAKLICFSSSYDIVSNMIYVNLCYGLIASDSGSGAFLPTWIAALYKRQLQLRLNYFFYITANNRHYWSDW